MARRPLPRRFSTGARTGSPATNVRGRHRSSAKKICRGRRPERFSTACCARSMVLHQAELIGSVIMSQAAYKSQDLNSDPQSCAAWVARFLAARGVDRIFGLQGGHIQPIWDHVARLGIRIVDVRDEGAAVHMAHAHSELTGALGVAMATAGPGVTNCVTAMANASLARIPVLLIGGCTSRPQANMGPLQDIPHVDILRPVTRTARTLRVPEYVVREFDEAVARAMGDNGEPGPVYLEIPTDVLRAHVLPQLVLDEWIEAKPARIVPPDPAAIAEAVEVFWSARRPVVITGRGARGASVPLMRLLDATGALYL